MKPIRLCLLFLVLQVSFPAIAIKAYFDYKVFYQPGSGPYAEFILSFEGTSMQYKKLDNDKVQASAEVTIVVENTNGVAGFRKIIAEGPAELDGLHSDFLALERMALPAGVYTLNITLRDLNEENAELATKNYQQKIEINFLSEGLFISDIELVSAYSPTEEQNAFSKSGFDIIPCVSNYYATHIQALMYYVEIYNSEIYFGHDTAFVVSTSIQNETGATVGEHMRLKREKGKPVCALIQAIDISKLATGEYWLVVEVRNSQNISVTSKRIKIERRFDTVAGQNLMLDENSLKHTFVGKYTDRDTLLAMVLSLTPISGNRESASIYNQFVYASLLQLQGFFYTFWENRNAADPEGEWLKYEEQLRLAHQLFGTRIRQGWETERGRVWLQYGKPNSRIERPHSSDYIPFEIWHYYAAGGGHNLKFLFYNPSLSGDYELLHADAPGEISNPSWREMVRSGFRNDPAQSNRNAFNQRDTNSGDELEELWFNPH